MAPAAGKLAIPSWVNRLTEYRSMLVPLASIGLLAVIVVPLSPVLMDILITANLAIAAVILMTTIFVARPLDFSVFPSLLLGTALFRLVLNIASTRLILLAGEAEEPGEAAGKVIEAFSSFVSGDSPVVGFVLFSILIIVQFVVVTKGATRISEVAARFTLDAMPGKQMAIDADLNAGLINEQQARNRREEIAQEADFYGAMDGSAKFVRGDAIAGIIITLINIVGGFIVGIAQMNLGFVESLDLFTRLTIGDGLVSQLPAFVISIAAGLIVTRSSGRKDLSTDLIEQLGSAWRPLAITAGFLGMLALTPLPVIPTVGLGSVAAGMAWYLYKKDQRTAVAVKEEGARKDTAAAAAEPEQMLHVDTLELEVGYGLVRLVDASQGGDLLKRISLTRRQIAADLGLIMPPVRIHDNMQLEPNQYRIKIRGNTIAQGMVIPNQFLAMDSGLVRQGAGRLEGTPARDPAFNLDAFWIDAGQRQRAESLNYIVADASNVLATHLAETVKAHAHELLTREETNNLITQLKQKASKLAEEVFSGESPLVKPGELQKVLQELLRERVPIRDLETIVETLGDWATRTKDIEILNEYVRNALRRTICNQYVQQPAATPSVIDGPSAPAAPKLYCVSLDPMLEDQISGFIQRTKEGTSMTMPPALANRIASAVARELQSLLAGGYPPVVLASPQVRAQVRRLIEPHMPNVAVLGYNEISKGVEVESLALVQLDPPSRQAQPPQPQGASR